ncbi:MAG TPA: hypothetical protein VMA09_24130 [Candidatus Binataceae bacterium]|nr:hypothetical protein [Candidatus Binataceae bacterium]
MNNLSVVENRERFDLDKYLRVAGATRPELFDWSAPGPRLDDDSLFCLGYMMDIELHTIVYMREMLSTQVIEDPAITAFLSCWGYEEFFHSRTIAKLLESQGASIDEQRFVELRQRRAADHLEQKVARIVSRLTRHFPAIHMTWGAINELSTLTGYQALADRARHPLLTTVLSRIIKDERRHFSFYFNQARIRLKDRAAQLLTSFAVRRFWSPVGSPVRGDSDMRHVCRTLFSDARGPGRLALIDSTIARLPGFEWFDLASRRCLGASPRQAINHANRLANAER